MTKWNPKTMPTPTEEIILAAIEGLEPKKQRIDGVTAQIRERMNGGASASAPTHSPANNGRHTMSPAARKRIAAAQRARWAALKGAADSKPAASQAKKAKRHISPEGRRRIIEATKKRWAAFRAAKKRAAK